MIKYLLIAQVHYIWVSIDCVMLSNQIPIQQLSIICEVVIDKYYDSFEVKTLMSITKCDALLRFVCLFFFLETYYTRDNLKLSYYECNNDERLFLLWTD